MMTAEKALEILNGVEFSEKYQGVQEYTEVLIVCKEALEKQIPKKVIFQSGFKGLRYCPCCNVRFIGWGMKYCGECGQALDWSENDG